MRTDEARMLHLQAHLDHLDGKGPLPPPVQRGRKRGSFNHEGLLRAGMYADGGNGELIDWLESQQREGHCTRGGALETFSASHGQLNEAWAAAALLFAVNRKATRLIELLRDWWWSEITLCNEMAIPGRENRPFDNKSAKKGERQPDVWGPGWRALQDGKLIGSTACRCLVWRLIMGHPIPKPSHRLWNQRYYLAARALRMLPEAELKALRPAPGFVPPLPYPLHVRRWETGFHAWWDVPPGLPDVARQARCEDGVLSVFEESPGGWDFQAPGAIDWPGLRPLAGETGPA